MEGFDNSTYGERFADVYDEWYGSITDTNACVDYLANAAGDGPVLELGVGTGRLAIPLANRSLAVTGVDSSQAMLDAMAAKQGGAGVEPVLADMAELDGTIQTGKFALAFIAYNTLFNLTTAHQQRACLASMAASLRPGGAAVIEAFVPDPDLVASSEVRPREVTADRVVLSVSQASTEAQEMRGQFVDITEAGIKLRPWHIRWATTDQLDVMAAEVGLTLSDRHSDWSGSAFDENSSVHVSVYRSTEALP